MKVNRNTCFSGESEIINSSLQSVMKCKGEEVERTLKVGDAIDTYRNLNKPKFFSMKAREGCFKNLVCGYATCVVMEDFCFIVGEKARQRVVINKVKNVHAYCRGRLCDARNGGVDTSKLDDYIRVSYSPYHGPDFYVVEDRRKNKMCGDVLDLNRCSYQHAIVSGSDVIMTNLRY